MITVLRPCRTIASRLLPLALTGFLGGCGVDPVGGDGVPYGAPVPQASFCTDEARRAPEQCSGMDSNCDGFVDRDLIVSDCTRKLLSYIAEVAHAQAQAQRQDGHAPLGCPSDGVGLGEAERNIYSYSGPLPASCNHLLDDDCADPARKNYWVSVIANTTISGVPDYRVVWGSSPSQYKWLGACAPQGTDGEGSSIPKLLVPSYDKNQNGSIDPCYEHTAGSVSFSLDGPVSSPILIRDIAALRDLRVSSKEVLRADSETRAKQLFRVENLLIDVQKLDGTWHKARIATNLDNDKEPMLKWQQELLCQ